MLNTSSMTNTDSFASNISYFNSANMSPTYSPLNYQYQNANYNNYQSPTSNNYQYNNYYYSNYNQ